MKERLAKFVKELRGEATQREFARLLGTSYTAVQDWEKQIRLPNAKNLKRLAYLKGWTQEDLIYYIFHTEIQGEQSSADPVERIITHLKTLSPAQMQALNEYLKIDVSYQQNIQMGLDDEILLSQKSWLGTAGESTTGFV